MEKGDDERLKDTFKRMKELEEQYQEETRESLINLLVFKEMAQEMLDTKENHIVLWCYVADKTGLKYLTDEMPKKYFTFNEFNGADAVYITEGEINIRVPKSMESIFPSIRYGDAPVMVQLSVSF